MNAGRGHHAGSYESMAGDQELRQAWQDPAHADFFDSRATYSLWRLRKVYENFNEFRLFLGQKSEIKGREFIEIGCATGELYRYLRKYHREFRYRGFDISKPAIERARQKYPEGCFELCKPDLSDVIAGDVRPAVVWARDVVQHQPDPFGYLSRLLQIANEVTILRIRTRDKGATVLDPKLSCQWHYNRWVPYIVLNMGEMLDVIRNVIPLGNLVVVKRYVQLGGLHNRFLPKECYYPHTGTAETSLYIARSEGGHSIPQVLVSTREDSDYVPPLILRGLDYVRRRLFAL